MFAASMAAFQTANAFSLPPITSMDAKTIAKQLAACPATGEVGAGPDKGLPEHDLQDLRTEDQDAASSDSTVMGESERQPCHAPNLSGFSLANASPSAGVTTVISTTWGS